MCVKKHRETLKYQKANGEKLKIIILLLKFKGLI